MRSVLSKAQLACVVAFPFAALFVSPGYFFEGLLPLSVAAWALWLIGMAAGQRAIPDSPAGRVAVSGLAALTLLYAVSIISSPDRPAAVGNLTLVLAYLGWVLAAGSTFSVKGRSNLAEPLAWFTAAVAAAWGLSERLAPQYVHFSHSKTAFGRLLEPIGYWNAMGALAGIGLVLAIAIASSPNRRQALRAAAAALSPLLMAALWLSFSRGALAATLCGLAALIAMSPSWRTVRVSVVALVLTGITAAVCESLPGIRTVTGPIAGRESDATLLLIALVGVSIAAAALQWWDQHRSSATERSLPRFCQKLAVTAAFLFALVPTTIVLTGSNDSRSTPAATGADASRLQSLESNRSRYWSVALDQFETAPLTGEGSGSFRGAWQRSSSGDTPALNAHSLELETAAELGSLGLLALTMLFAGVWLAGRGQRRATPLAMAGASAGLSLFLAHSTIDWDWQVPGLMYTVGLLAAAVCFLPRPGTTPKEPRWINAVAILIALAAITWSAHLWEANTLMKEAGRMSETAKILGWTPEREDYVLTRLNEAAWLNPDPRVQIDLAVAQFQMGRTKDAAAIALKAARSNPDWWLGWSLVWRLDGGANPTLANAARQRGLYLRGLGPLRDSRIP